MSRGRIGQLTRILFLVALGAAAAVCGNDDSVGGNSAFVGGSCHGDGDCDDMCAMGGDFPGGTCTVPCHEDNDCPEGTACIDKQGGICLLACHQDGDCRHGYDCDSKDREGHSGELAVCIE